jgi:hypothetical protein
MVRVVDDEPGAPTHRAQVSSEVVAPWGDGFVDFLTWRLRGLMTFSAWRVWMLAVVAAFGLLSGALDHDAEGLVTGGELLAGLLALFFVPPLLGDAFKRFLARFRQPLDRR